MITTCSGDVSPTSAAARYATAVHAIAAAIAAELEADGASGDAAWEAAEAAFRRQRTGPHRWVFEGDAALRASAHLMEALEPGPGQAGALQATLGVTASIVARFDVFARLAELRDMDA